MKHLKKGKRKFVRQINIFNEVDNMNEFGEIIRCEVCGVSMDELKDCCSEKCSKKAIENIFGK